MNSRKLAKKLIKRLNLLCQDPEVRQVISRLIETRIPAPESLRDHPTIRLDHEYHSQNLVGFLGILNGLVGIKDLGCRGLVKGPIVAVYDEESHQLLRFQLYDESEHKPSFDCPCCLGSGVNPWRDDSCPACRGTGVRPKATTGG